MNNNPYNNPYVKINPFRITVITKEATDMEREDMVGMAMLHMVQMDTTGILINKIMADTVMTGIDIEATSKKTLVIAVPAWVLPVAPVVCCQCAFVD